MKERELDEGIELPNIQKHYMRINNYLSLFVYVNETTDKITYMVMLGKYHENIYENLVEGFKTMTSILNPEKGEATIKQLVLYDLGLNSEMDLNPSTSTFVLEDVLYKKSYDEGIIRLEILPSN